MADDRADSPREGPPPLGSWPAFYAVVALTATAMILLLYWLSSAFNVPLEPR